MAATMIVRTVVGIVTEAMAAIRPLPSGQRTALHIIPIALLPAQPALHQFIGARQDMERISTAMVTERHVNETAMQRLWAAMMFDRRGII